MMALPSAINGADAYGLTMFDDTGLLCVDAIDSNRHITYKYNQPVPGVKEKKISSPPASPYL
jgi:hypothetical protein